MCNCKVKWLICNRHENKSKKYGFVLGLFLLCIAGVICYWKGDKKCDQLNLGRGIKLGRI